MFSLKDYIKKKDVIHDSGLKVLSPSELSALQYLLLDTYKDIMKVSEKYGFHIFMGGGSALGAYRHKGFIPWDDDMDLMIPRSEYRGFFDAFSKEFPDKYSIAAPFHGSLYFSDAIHVIRKDSLLKCLFDYSEIRPLGVAVDIVAVESVPDNRALYFIHGVISNLLLYIMHSKEILVCRNSYSDKYFSQNIISLIFYWIRLMIGCIFFFISYKNIVVLFDKWISMVRGSSKVTIPSGRNHYFGETVFYNDFYPLRECLFEREKSYIPNKPEIYLEKLYGKNFNLIPPESKREIHAYVEFITNI